MKYIIYSLHTPGENEVRYIGRSSSFLNRPKHHLYEARYQTDGECKLQLYVDRWIRTLPNMEYEIKVVESWDGTGGSNEWLNDRERFWIAFYHDAGHRLTNATDGGIGMLGYQHSEESKKKISEAGVGRVFSDERRKNISDSLMGNKNGLGHTVKHSEETKQRLREVRLGTTRPEQSGEKHWTARRDFDSSLKKPGVKGSPVICTSDGKEFDSIGEAAKFYNLSGSVVSRSLDGHVGRSGLRFKRK